MRSVEGMRNLAMKTKLIGLLVIAAAVAGVVVYKVAAKPKAPVAAATANGKVPRVLLFADMGEADEDCGCGQIIRSVREVAAHGVVTRENDDDLGKRYKVTTSPTVVILDGEGLEQSRYEGESKTTIAKLRDDLAKLDGGAAAK